MARTMKRGDSNPPLTGRVSDASGPVALTGASVTILCKSASLPLLTLAASPVDSPTTGAWSHTFSASETASVGIFEVEVEVIDGSGGVQTFPNGANDETFTILQDLGGS